ncbi:HotDog domain-containing protein [Fusarium oxysporum]|nr:HotDog domain-containing protein [Fusarium oxysporum]
MRYHLRLVSVSCTADHATAVFSLIRGQYLTNCIGSIYGGTVALIYDMCITMCTAPLAREGFWEFRGVSRNLSITYLRPAKPDMDIIVICEVLHIGARVATIRGEMID